MTISVSECGQSLSSDGCLLATTTVTVIWSSAASDLSRYNVTCESAGTACTNFNYASTTATSTVYTVPADNTTYTFKAKAIDTSGNESNQQTAGVEIATRPLAINEIAWAGTSAARAEDEWIELYNPTGKTVNLANWVLRSSTDNSPYVTLSGTISSGGFFVLERTDDTVITDRAADKIYTGSLVNTGEVLELSRASTTIDQTPTISSCSGWCYGSNSGSYPTMERYLASDSGTTTANWGSFSTLPANGLNADNAAVSGTPGKRNSINYYISNTTLTADTTVKKSRSPYIVPGTFTVPSGVNLTIEPGIVIKINGSTPFLINGRITAEGTSAEKIVFTSINDDDCGISGGCGDTNATTTAAAAGDWAALKIASGAGTSTISYAVIRYAGIEDGSDAYWANLRIENASTTIKNSIIEKSKTYGIWMKNASGGTLENNIVRENNRNISGQTRGIGLVLTASSPTITGNQFTANTKGLIMESASAPSLTNNTFTQQTDAALEVSNSYPTFSGNSASSNGTNGILIQNSFSQDHTLSADLPYVFTGVSTVQSGATLTIPASTVVKFASDGSSLTIAGRLIASGTSGGNVVFTSIKDDTSGGDTNNDSASTSPSAGDWRNLTFTNNNATSTLTYAAVRYGGDKSASNPDDGAIRIKNSSIEIRNSTIEKNYLIGVWMQTSTSTLITDSFVKNHNDSTSETFYGLFLTASSTPTIRNTIFSQNESHIFYDSTSTTTDAGGNTFE